MRHASRHATAFRSTGRVQVSTTDGRPFYVFDNPGTFTLPAGSYTLSGGSVIGRMPKRRGHEPSAPIRIPIPKKVRIVFAPNPFKAVISLPDGIIVADPSLRNLPAFCLAFILFHEIGHYYYADEESCDAFAADEMHRRGYNASQIAIAPQLTMGDAHRRLCTFTHAKRLDNER